MMSLFSINAFAGTSEYKINDVDELKTELQYYEERGVLTEDVQETIMEDTTPAAIEEFVEEKTELMIDELNSLDLDSLIDEELGTGEVVIDLGEGCEVTVEVEEGEDFDLFASIHNFIFEAAYAATNGETMWKAYGNRYFTAKVTTLLGAGSCTMTLENHYSLSASGITERYGISDAIGLSATTSISSETPIITDTYATTKGASDVNMYAKYAYRSGASSGNFRINTAVGYVDKDSSAGKIKVKHSWNWQ